MYKRGELSRLAVNLLIVSLILILSVIIFFIVKNVLNNQHQEVFDDSTLDLKISQVQKVDDSTLNVTVKRNEGQGEFVALSFVVDDGITTEVIRKNTSLDEFENQSFSLNFILMNSSKIKKISVTPIYINQSGKEVIGNVKDEYITPNTCSNYCPVGAQCGVNGCGMKCGGGCNNGYFCLNYKCIKESSGGGGGGGSSSDDDANPTCTDTCSSLVYQCGTQTICGSSVNCGNCSTNYTCQANGTCMKICTPGCAGKSCGDDECAGTCGTCTTGYTCNSTGQCAANTCSGSSNQSCSITNGVGIQIRTCNNPPTWDAWSNCTVLSCNTNYIQSGNTCVASTCSGSSTQSCNIANGTGSQSRNCTSGVWGSWGTCNVVSCNSGYAPCGNSCNISSRSCNIANGIGSQSRTCANNVWGSWGTCTVVSCNSCYVPSGNSCVAATCVGSTTQSCSIISGLGQQSRTCSCGSWSAWGTCTVSSCNSCYIQSGNTCVVNTCNDNNACTTDLCSSGACSNIPISNCCTSASQCNDNNACTTDLCSSGACSNIPISNCCTSASQCNDNNACTTDLCSISTGICSNVLITPCCGNSVREGTEQCDCGTNGCTSSELNGQTCASRLGTGYTGTLNCTSSCTFNTNSCVAPCVPTTCAALGRNCGTAPNGCGGTLNCGSCTTGYSCQTNGTCIKDIVVTCNGVSCKSGEYCFNGACLLNVTGHTYFVATNGNDNNPGTFSQPWLTWQKAVVESRPGDITYIGGGTWQPTSHVVVNGWETWAVGMYIDPKSVGVGRSGTAAAPIRYYNYPGEKPILDGSLVGLDEGFNGGIDIEATQYLEFRGLTIENIYQRASGSEAFGIGSFDSANLHFENMVVHDIDGRGYQHWGGAWTQWGNEADLEAYYPSNFQSDNSSWINCDAYNLFDKYSSSPGNAADGFIAHGHYGNYFNFQGRRAWNYSDDGFNTFFEAYTIIKNCWAMSTDKYKDLGSWNIEGNGFKLNGVNYRRIPNYQLFGEKFVRVENSIAANCMGRGLINNIDVYEDDPNTKPSNGLFYSNLGYKDDTGLYDGGENFEGKIRTTVYKNNIAYASTSTNPLYQVGIYYPSIYPHANNTWIGTGGELDWPGWEDNPAVIVTNADFVSLDYWQLTRPRKADGSLPDVTFGHLAQGSDLIDTGIVVSGYHCSTSGAHAGQNCVEWYGAAPDLGPFESNY